MATAQSLPGLPAGYKPGLEGVIAGISQISEVDADQDALTYRGYVAHELAEKCTFSEVAYLLLIGKLPDKKQFEDFKQKLKQNRAIPKDVLSLLKKLPKNANPMMAFECAVTLLQMVDPDRDRIDEEGNMNKAIRLIAVSPTLVAAQLRISQGLDPIDPDPNLKHGENFLYMATGKKPDDVVAKAFDATMILYAEHGFNASTFAALVTSSTLSDMHSAVVSAIGALKGPLHGGANEKAIEMLLKVDGSNVESRLMEALSRKEKIMGFGHRVYKKQDSRAPLMKRLAKATADRLGDTKLFDLSVKIEDIMMREKKLFPNVDFHGGVFYYLIGLPTQIYTPIFAMSRMVGWTAHVNEQQKANRLIRPKSYYSGEKNLPFIPLDQR